MSTRDLIALAAQTVSKPETVTPSLLNIALDLVQQLLNVCDNNRISLEHIPAFALRSNEWNTALIQIFRAFYEEELAFSINNSIFDAPKNPTLFVTPLTSFPE